MTALQWILLVLILASCVLLILVVLIQRGRGEGLAGAFGGGGSSAFGAKTGDVFTGITVVLAAIFLLLNVVGNYVFLPAEADTGRAVQRAPGPAPAPATGTPTPAIPGAPPATPPGAADTGTEPGGGGEVETPRPAATRHHSP